MPYCRRAERGYVASHACVICGRQPWGLEDVASYAEGQADAKGYRVHVPEAIDA